MRKQDSSSGHPRRHPGGGAAEKANRFPDDGKRSLSFAQLFPLLSSSLSIGYKGTSVAG
jgi:hypothetical protein